MNGYGVRLSELPAGADVDDGLNNVLAIVVNETEGRELVGNGDGELVVVHQADFFDFGGVVDIVEEDLVADYAGLLS